jgi:hypothetical protein
LREESNKIWQEVRQMREDMQKESSRVWDEIRRLREDMERGPAGEEARCVGRAFGGCERGGV